MENEPFEVSLDRYARGPARLSQALDGLSDAEVDVQPAPGQWSIRQILHHIVDGDAMFGICLRVALATPGAEFHHGWYRSNDIWAEQLRYDRRPWQPALKLFTANRAYLSELLRLMPDRFDNSIQFYWHGATEPQEVTVAAIVRSQGQHVFTHSTEIEAIRKQLRER